MKLPTTRREVGPFAWVLLHGLGDCQGSFSLLTGELRALADYTLVPDLARFWEDSSEMRSNPAGALAVAMAPEVARWQSEQRAPIFIAGHSAGARVATELAFHIPAVCGIALLEGSYRPSDVAAVSRYEDDEGRDSGRRRLIDESRMRAGQSSRSHDYAVSVADTDPGMFRHIVDDIVQRSGAAFERLRQLRSPLIYLAGALSPGSGQSELAGLRAATDATVSVIPAAGHWVHVDAPTIVARELRSWASACVAP